MPSVPRDMAEFRLNEDECKLRIRSDVLLQEAHCTIDADGTKYLVFTGAVASTRVALRVKYGSWQYNSTTHELELKGGPQLADKLVRDMVHASSEEDVDLAPIAPAEA